MAQLFPASHMGFTAPSAQLPASTQPARKTKSTSPTRCETTLGSSGLWLSTVRRLNSRILIIGEIDPGSPAAEAGLRPGWPLQMYTERVDAGHTHVIVDVLPLSDADVRKLALHNTLPSLSPGPRHFDFETRCVPDKTHFESRQLPDGTLYIRFNDFNASETASVASVLQGAGMHPVILDLRYNEGGFASLLLDHLIPHGMPLYNIQDRTGTHTLRARYESPQYDGRLAVLIGPSTSSAAEISAWVLHQAGRAILIGRPTNGSVLGSRNYPLPDGGSIQIAVDNVTMPDGTVLESRGIAPDIEIEPTPDQLRAGRDPALEAADRALHR
ncbi:S41 family peptidase [Gluconobacter thailandicus]|nr:S41 family peptidase [Gluconobacter thailandicus]